jgi:sulfur transfer complex TusBCD TusB component (DsrH family)
VKTLHILRKRKDALAEEAISSEAASGGEGSVTVLLIQEAVLGSPSVPAKIFVNNQDAQARGAVRTYTGVDYQQICQMILNHDRTVVW